MNFLFSKNFWNVQVFVSAHLAFLPTQTSNMVLGLDMGALAWMVPPLGTAAPHTLKDTWLAKGFARVGTHCFP